MKTTKKQEYQFEKNLKLTSNRPQIKAMLVNATFDDSLIVEKAGGICKIKYLFSNLEIQISSCIDPKKYAQEVIKIEFEAKKEVVNKYTVAVVFLADPHIIEEFFNKFDWFWQVFVVFPSADYFYTLMHFYDFSELFKNERFMPFFFNDKDVTNKNVLSNMQNTGYIYRGVALFGYKPFDLISGDLLNLVTNSIKDLTLFLQTSIQTSFFFGDKIMLNEIRSLDKFIKYPDVSIFQNKLYGKPIICVTSGPSLRKNIDLLKSIQDEVYIIATASVLKPLISNNIKPDLVTILDMQEEVIRYLEGIDTSKMTIAIEMSCYHGVMEKIKADFVISVAGTLGKECLSLYLSMLGIEIPPEAKITGAFTVAFMSILIAEKMKASEIILLGQDLAMSDTTHVEGGRFTHQVEIVQRDGNEYFKYPYFDGEKETLEAVIWVKGYFNDRVPTTPSYDSFRRYLETLIRINNLKVINCTEGGSYIEGTEHISLLEAYEKYIKKNKVEIKQLNLQKVREYDFKILAERLAKFNNLIDRYEKLLKLANEGLNKVNQLSRLKEKDTENYLESNKMKQISEDFNDLMQKMLSEYQEEMAHISQLGSAEFFLYNHIMKTNNKDYTNEDLNADERNKVTLMFSAVSNSMTLFVEELRKVVKKIKAQYGID